MFHSCNAPKLEPINGISNEVRASTMVCFACLVFRDRAYISVCSFNIRYNFYGAHTKMQCKTELHCCIHEYVTKGQRDLLYFFAKSAIAFYFARESTLPPQTLCRPILPSFTFTSIWHFPCSFYGYILWAIQYSLYVFRLIYLFLAPFPLHNTADKRCIQPQFPPLTFCTYYSWWFSSIWN